MRSPSIFATMRNTPWVDGCCGPMLTSTGSTLIGTLTSPPISLSVDGEGERCLLLPGARVLRAELLAGLARHLLRELAEAGLTATGQRHEILSQRVTGERIPEEQPREAGVTFEAHTHEVVYLPLLEPCAGPQRGDRRHHGILVVAGDLHLEQVVPGEGGEVIDHVDAGDHVDAAELREELALEVHLVADEAHP